MANEFRVKNGLIVDEASNGAGVLTIADGDIANDDGSIAITVVDGQSVTIGKEGSHANIVVTPHGTAGSEKITVLNTTGTDAAAIKLNAAAGGIDVDAANEIVVTTTSADGHISLVSAHTAGEAIHLDGNANVGSIVKIDAGILDINVDDALTIDAADEIVITTTSADGHISLVTAHTAGVALHIDADANAGSIVDIDAGILDIDVTAGITIDGTTMSIDGTDDSNITVTGSGKDLDIAVAGAGTQELRIASAGTGASALHLNASAGGINIDSADMIDIDAADEITLTTTSADGHISLVSAHTAGVAFHLDANADAGSIVDIDAGILQINTDGTMTVASAGAYSLTGAGTIGIASGGDMTFNDGVNDTFFYTDTFTITPKHGASNAATATTLTIGNAASGASNADRSIHLAIAEAVYRIALNLDGSGSMSAPIIEMGVGGTVTANTTTALPTQAQYTTAATAFAFGSAGSVYRIGSDNATSGQVLTFDGTEWLAAAAASGGIDVSGTNNRMVRMHNTDDIQDTGITVDDSDNVSGMGTLGVGAITSTGDAAFTSDTATFTSANTTDPLVIIENTTNDVNGATLRFVKDRGTAGTDGMDIGTISFFGDNAAQEQTAFASIVAEVSTAADTDEAGKLSFFVSESNGTAAQLTAGLILVGQSTDDGEVDVTIGAGAGSTTTIAGHLTVNGTTTTINSSTVTIDDLSFNMAADVTASASLDGAGIILGATNYASGSSFANNPTLLYDHTGTRWEFSAHDVELPADVFIGNDLSLTSDSAVFNMGAGNDFTITHDGTTGATIAGNPITITAGGASTWSTSAGALTLTSAAACTWSTTAGVLTIDGDDGVQISSTAAGNIDLDSFADIVLDSADDKHIIFQQATVPYLSIGQGTTAIANIADSAGVTPIDVFDCTVYQAVKYLILVEDITSNDYMTAELLVLGDNIPSTAVGYMTIYAVIYNSTELGTFSVTGSGDNITLNYDPTEIGSKNHKVRVVAQRISALS